MSKTKTTSRLVAPKVIAEHCGVTVSAVQRWVATGRIPFIRVAGHALRFDLREALLAVGIPEDRIPEEPSAYVRVATQPDENQSSLDVEAPRLVYASVVARHASVSVNTVRNWAKDGRIPHVMLADKVMRFDLVETLKAIGVPFTTNAQQETA